MPRRIAPSELLQAPFTSHAAVQAGLTREQLRSRQWRRLLRDVYVSACVPDSLELRVAAVQLVLPIGAAVSGTTAAWLHGVDLRTAGETVEVTLPRSVLRTRRQGVRLRHALLPDDDVVLLGGVPVTTALRTAFDLGRRPNPVEAVVALDAFLHARLVTVDELAAYIDAHPGWRGVRQAQHALGRSDGRAESPMETRVRLVLVLSGLPVPQLQFELVDAAGRFIARLDLAYAEVQHALEFDGRHHAHQLVADLARQNAILDQNWTLGRYTATDVYRRHELIVIQTARRLGVPPPPIPSILRKSLVAARAEAR